MEQQTLSAEGLNSFLSKVFLWMFAGLLTTATSAYLVASNVELAISLNRMYLLFVFAELGLVIALTRGAMKFKYSTTIILFMVYSVVNGLTLSIIFYAYAASAIYSAFLTASLIFAVMALYGYVTKTDLTQFRSFLMAGLIAVVAGMFLNMFIGSSGLGYLITIVGVVIFTGLIAYDMQRLKSYYALSVSKGGEIEGNLAVTGALTLYLDFINLFLMLLRLFGGRD